MCRDGPGCDRKICFFAHAINELRTATGGVLGGTGGAPDGMDGGMGGWQQQQPEQYHQQQYQYQQQQQQQQLVYHGAGTMAFAQMAAAMPQMDSSVHHQTPSLANQVRYPSASDWSDIMAYNSVQPPSNSPTGDHPAPRMLLDAYGAAGRHSDDTAAATELLQSLIQEAVDRRQEAAHAAVEARVAAEGAAALVGQLLLAPSPEVGVAYSAVQPALQAGGTFVLNGGGGGQSYATSNGGSGPLVQLVSVMNSPNGTAGAAQLFAGPQPSIMMQQAVPAAGGGWMLLPAGTVPPAPVIWQSAV